MPILRVDEMGQIYASSPDREDGGGYGHSPECVPQGDLTLGAAYLKAGASRTNDLLTARRNQEAADRAEEEALRRAKLARKMQKRFEADQEELMHHPAMQEAAVRKALSGPCTCEYKQPLTGNVMTANGLSGWAGMSRDQKTIHNAVLGMGRDTSFSVDPVEARQAQMRKQAEKLLRLKARR